MFQQLIPDAWVQAGGWTLLHSLWQGAIITLLLAFMLGRTREQSPAFRYHLNVGALFLLFTSVVVTFLYYYEPAVAEVPFRAFVPETVYSQELALSTSGESETPGFLNRTFPFLLQLWLLGVAFMGLRMLAELFYLHRLRSTNVRPVEIGWQERMLRISSELGVRTPVTLKESLRVSSPMLVGWIKPVVLLPVGMLNGLTAQQVECILAHELAHVRRLDYLINLLQSAVEVLLFFNPAVWWISAQIREEREHCCDELAVSVTGDRLTLVKTLAQLEEWRLQQGQLGLAFNGRPQGMLGRVQRLLGGESTVRIIGKGLWSFLLVSLLSGALAIRTQGETPSQLRIWENVGFAMDEIGVEDPIQVEDSEVELYEDYPAPEPQEDEMQLTEPLESLQEPPLRALSSELDHQLRATYRLSSLDTIPPIDKELQAKMEALQKEMELLQKEMMDSPEMKKIEALTKQHSEEMKQLEEKMMRQNGSYEELMREQEKVMRELEAKHQQLWESEPFSTMQEEMMKLTEKYQLQAEEIARKFENNPELMEMKLDSVSMILERRQEAFEKEYGAAMKAMEKEMEALENSPEMKAYEERMEAMNEEMEKMMEDKFEPLEEEMERLQEQMEERFEKRMEELAEKMEQLERERWKRLERREE
jgi:beta-lactamase regulating signal transducer with metallopeptidase domain